jgi:hypothetical protein
LLLSDRSLLLCGLLLRHGLLLLLHRLLLPLKNRLLLLKDLLLLLKDLLLLSKLFLLHGALLLLLLLILLLRCLPLFLFHRLLLLLFLLLASAVRPRCRPLADCSTGACSGPGADGRPHHRARRATYGRTRSGARRCAAQATDPGAGALRRRAFRFLACVRRTTREPRCGDADRQRYCAHFHDDSSVT